ncbi:SDR family oxidoreductase [Actinophytocola algeriensis]|uniref:3-oxoacyl-[acyl-carrier protein] reductase n=1 Tax=Actinophytocola algeriensis TaxID=1768010 RepID=A0A7W7VH56_9PSEU|nr:SDR family NAD(P)-dependent oxidoreductase [Actinophytocola algeriensis]MBB4910063.1 3-oxoacyl-[acyl-carrier protein] reductase [Actinophytocola algeriensis]MBE1476053.1 3-oxoacyl-[acyl-carrier protein] reductase [Actinophytocola algeriensis]
MSVAVVTGGARGIGAGIAKRLRADGHRVAVLDVDLTGAEGDVLLDCDVASEESVTIAFDKVSSVLGVPSIVVNNAGFARDQPLHEMSLSDWDAVVDVCLRGAFLTTRLAAPAMMAAGFGRIVNISSTSALGDPERVQYVAAKSGLNGFTKAAALELGPFGVTVNAVAPGFTVTNMTVRSAARRGRTLEEHIRITAEESPVRRAGHPEDIAHAVSFFASEGAGYVTGQVLYVAGAPLG